MLSLLLTTWVAGQGQAFEMSFPTEPGLTGVTVRWSGHQLPFMRSGDQWVAIVGVDLDSKPGDHAVDVTFAYADVVNRYGTTLERFMDDPRGIMRLVLASHVQLSGADRDSITHVLHQVYNEHWPQMDEWIPSLPPGANSETGPRSRDVRALRPYYTGKSFTGR